MKIDSDFGFEDGLFVSFTLGLLRATFSFTIGFNSKPTWANHYPESVRYKRAPHTQALN
jgi:hypothetical protein